MTTELTLRNGEVTKINGTKIICVGSEKGGPGKSTIVVNLAAIAVQYNLKLLVIDADKQRTTSMWVAVRNKDESLKKVLCVEKRGSDLTHSIREYAKQKGENGKPMYDWILIDTPGVDSDEFSCAALTSHVIVIPTKTTSFDTWTFPTTFTTVNKIMAIRDENPPRAIVIPSMVTTHPLREPKQIAKIARFVAKMPILEFGKTIIHQREDFADSPALGQSASEYAPNSVAARESHDLFEEVLHA